MPIDLHHVSHGTEGPPIVILHGLLGSSRNWTSIARRLGKRHQVHALDLRNHGDSPHAGAFTYDDLVDDVLQWLKKNASQPVTLLGHSLGGKVAMRLACLHPVRVGRLIVVDASPCPAPPRWEAEFEAMGSLDVDALTNRQQAEEFLEQRGISDWAFRKFLTSNIDRDNAGNYAWKIDLAGLHKSLPAVFGPALEPGWTYGGPTLLIRGGDSQFAPERDIDAMRAFFPQLEVQTLPEAGHNVHADAPEAFLEAVLQFQSEAF